MPKPPVKSVAFLAMLLLAEACLARSRGVRVDFGEEWSSAQPIGSAACPGTTSGSTIVAWNSYYLVGSEDTKYLADAYCQTTQAGEFNGSGISSEDSPYLSRLVGLNSDDRVTAIRYTFLDRSRFDEAKQGFQWVVYSFPGAKLIGFNSSDGFPLTAATRITQYSPEGDAYWSADQYPNGEYYCLLGSGSSGSFSGSYIVVDEAWQFSAENDFTPSYQNACVRQLTGAFSDSFEDTP
jgi:hypothetical protein